MARTFSQGYYHPRHPEKYKGKIDRIVFRSSWEFSFCQFCDSNQRILEWASEPFFIPYLNAVDNKYHKYFPDFYISYLNNQDKVEREVIEIKPFDQITAPTSVGKTKKRLLYEHLTYIKNTSKWKYAEEFCKAHGLKFRIITNFNLFK